MPIVDLATPDIGAPLDTPKGFVVTPGQDDIDHGSDAPGLGSVVGAAFRQDNLVTNLLRKETVDNQPDGTNVWDEIRGTKYEPRWESFVDDRSRPAVEARKRKIDQEDEDRKVLHAAPWYQSVPAQIAAGAVDLPTLMPGGVFVRGVKGGFSLAKSALSVGTAAGVSTLAQEAGLQELQETRPLSESAVNIGASVFLGGLFGAAGGKALTRGEWARSVRDMDRTTYLGVDIPGTPVEGKLLADGGVSGDDLANQFAWFEAYHGSPHDFDRFDMSKIGTGEGAQAYGHGLYFAQEPRVAKSYRDLADVTIGGARFDANNPVHRAAQMADDYGSKEAAIKEASARAQHDPGDYWQEVERRLQSDKPLPEVKSEGNLYKVRINADKGRMLDWDKPLSQQSETVKMALNAIDRPMFDAWKQSGAWDHVKGETLYRELAGGLTNKAHADGLHVDASRLLRERGVAGIKYLDQGSRTNVDVNALRGSLSMWETALRKTPNDAYVKGQVSSLRSQLEAADRGGTSNFVVFDDSLVEIVDKNGVPIARGSSGALTSAGAAAVGPRGIEQNAIAGRAAGAVAASTARLNPALRLLQSPSAATREIGTQLFENSLYLKKNFDGVASEPAVETLMKEWNGGLASAVRGTDTAYSGYVKAGGTLSRHDFRAAVGKAMRRNDVDGDPHITKAAQEWRAKVFDPLKDAAIEAKLLPPDVSVETAASYFSRMWNRNKLIAQEGKFKQIVRDWVDTQAPKWAEAFDRETTAGAAKLKDEKLAEFLTERRVEREARFGDMRDPGRSIADEVFNTLTGKTSDGARPEFLTVKARGPLKERTFDIPDHLVEDFLEHDVDLVGRRYARIMGADVEIARKFGSVDMVEQLQKIRDDYARLRQGITDEKQLKKLGDQENADIRDLESLRDLLRNGSVFNHAVEQNYTRIVRSANHINYLRSMGEVVLASLTDAVRPAMVHGLGQFMQTVPQLLGNLKGIRLLVAEAQLAGNVAERTLGHRLATISEIIDPYASRGPIEAFLANMTNVASKWNGIRIWTDWMKSVASVMTQNRILQNSTDFASAKPSERAYLAYLGIDQSMAERIAKQFEKHGETVDGVKVANTGAWTDRVAVRTYRAAMNKDVDSIIVQKGVADTPLFSNTPTGRALLQFKSFALASHQRVLLRGLQEKQSRFVGGMVAMATAGMAITYLKALSGNRTERQSSISENPGWWIGEGLDRSGVLAVPMELANTFERASGFNPIKTPMKAFDQGSAQSQKIQNRNEIGSLLGPSAGLVQDVLTVGGIPKRVASGEDVSQGQKNAGERLLPFNSYAGIRQMLRYLVNQQD